MGAFLASFDKPWVLDSGAFSHMKGIEDKFHSFSFQPYSSY